MHNAQCVRTMMTEDEFRRIVLGMTGVIESAHMGHPDFRVNGRIFATLHADREWGMVKLTPEQQGPYVRDFPGVFVPESGAWGRQGCTAVRLAAIDEETLGEALTLAWRNASDRPPAPSRGRRSKGARGR